MKFFNNVQGRISPHFMYFEWFKYIITVYLITMHNFSCLGSNFTVYKIYISPNFTALYIIFSGVFNIKSSLHCSCTSIFHHFFMLYSHRKWPHVFLCKINWLFLHQLFVLTRFLENMLKQSDIAHGIFT